MSGNGVITRHPRGKATAEVAEVTTQLQAAREKVARTLMTLQGDFHRADRFREVARKHPLLMLGGAFLVGYAVGRLFTRDD